MILKRGISLSGKKVPIGRIIGTVINTLLIIVVLLTAGVLMLSSLKGGTFEIFGKSWYYYQSDAMTGEIERNEMVIIEDISPSDFENGDIVEVADFRGKFIGRGFYNPASQISLRILTRNDEPCDRAFFAKRIQDAWDYRKLMCDIL